MMRQYELVERVKSYNEAADETALDRAYVFAMKAHGQQTRASGDPYFSHPLEVAGILTELKLDDATIITALLHDTVEDTDVTYDDIETAFGPEVRELVHGVTKLTQLELSSEQTKQAENFRKLLVAVAKDVRVLLVKLADRLHNMRTLHYVPKPEKRRRIAQETMDIYAPLAGLVGMQNMREELEDIAFGVINPMARESVVRRLHYLEGEGGDVVARITAALKDTLASAGIEARVFGRAKRPYSIFRKMERKHISFEQLSDIIGFRIVTQDVADCYGALGVLHTKWQCVPGRFKDYISTPKRNDYRSIHTTLIGPESHRVEVQIRTVQMDEVAERGLAAHWQYKENPENRSLADLLETTRAVRALRDMVATLGHGSTSPVEFLENTKLEMYLDQVYCFTPKGDLIALPRGATPVDFAYAVHTHVGDTTVGAKVNGHHVPLRSRLQNGDMVEIVRSKLPAPRPEWEGFVVTGKARSAIRRFVRQAKRDQFIQLGKAIAERVCADYEQDYSEKALEAALPRLKKVTLDDLYEDIGEGMITARDLIAKVFPGLDVDEEAPGRPRRRKRAPSSKGRGDRVDGIPIRGLMPGVAVKMAQCCHPLPGDRIVGIVTAGQGVTVHTIDCETLEQYQDAPERWLDLSWDETEGGTLVPVGRLKLIVTNERGTLGTLSNVVASNNANISNLKITDRNPLYYEMVLDIEVEDVKHLSEIVAGLRASPPVQTVERVRG